MKTSFRGIINRLRVISDLENEESDEIIN